jgi:hypothetical protein
MIHHDKIHDKNSHSLYIYLISFFLLHIHVLFGSNELFSRFERPCLCSSFSMFKINCVHMYRKISFLFKAFPTCFTFMLSLIQIRLDLLHDSVLVGPSGYTTSQFKLWDFQISFLFKAFPTCFTFIFSLIGMNHFHMNWKIFFLFKAFPTCFTFMFSLIQMKCFTYIERSPFYSKHFPHFHIHWHPWFCFVLFANIQFLIKYENNLLAS